MTTFYDELGTPVAYSHDDVHIYAFSGEPLAYFRTNSVYSFGGSHMGWYINGWIRKLKPLISLRGLRPLKNIRENKPLRPLLRSQWSRLRLEDLLDS
jgi:hypothetical protein